MSLLESEREEELSKTKTEIKMIIRATPAMAASKQL